MGELRPEELAMMNVAKNDVSNFNKGSAIRAAIKDKEDSADLSLNLLSVPDSTNARRGSNGSIHSVASVTVLDAVGRQTWDKKIDFLLSVVGFAVDLSNVWRFPYLVYKNGGGAFLIAYFSQYILAGVPLFYMELALGQYNKKGSITTWGRICPMFKGIGYCVVMIAFYVDLFYNVIISWAIYFMFNSFSSHLPWSSCNNTWNTDACYAPQDVYAENNGSDVCREPNVNFSLYRSSSNEFLYRGVFKTDEFNDWTNPGPIKWELVACLLATYLICYFSLWKGIKMSGKVVWFTAVFPYIVIAILLVRGLTLPGSSEGIKFYLTPNMTKLLEGELWFDSATQVFFSLGPGFGVLMAYASYNQFHNNVYHDALITSMINTLTSVLAGFVVFSVLGYMACQSGRAVKDVAREGVGLVFEVYPEALATMPGSTFFSIAFFMMLVTLGLDSSFGGSEAIITALSDEIPWILNHREIFIAMLFGTYFSIGLLTCTGGGIFYVEFLNLYAPMIGLVTAVLCETFVVSWIYGLNRFCSDIQEMLGFYPGRFWRFCWAFVGPVFLFFTLVYGLIAQAGAPSKVIDKEMPDWLIAFSWCLAFSSVCAIPLKAAYTIIRAPGNSLKEKLRASVKPWKDTRTPSSYSTNLLGTTSPLAGLTTHHRVGTQTSPITTPPPVAPPSVLVCDMANHPHNRYHAHTVYLISLPEPTECIPCSNAYYGPSIVDDESTNTYRI